MMKSKLFILLTLTFKLCYSKLAIYLIGDSISYRIYRFGIVPTYNCAEEDTWITRPVEKVLYNGFYGDYTDNKAWKCNSLMVSRVGFAFHWGVFTDPFSAWATHRSPNDTTSSVQNIMSSIEEFQLRTKNETEVVFLLSSNLWDVYRYESLQQKESIDKWLQEYRLDYSALVMNITSKLRKKVDTLVLQTTHFVKLGQYRAWSTFINDEIVKIAAFFQIPLFDPRLFVEDNDMHLAPRDNRHQTNEVSMLYAIQIGLKNWTHESTSKCADNNYLPGTPVSLYGSKAYYIIKEDFKKHWIPNWDTLNQLGIKLNNVLTLSDKQFNSIVEGEAVPPCQC